LTILWCLY